MNILEEFLQTYEEYANVRKPKNAFKCTTKLLEEAGEIAEAVLACSGNARKQAKIEAEGQTPLERLGEELGDVIIAVMHIAHSEKLVKEQIFLNAIQKMQRKTLRKLNE
jgi:NTP pyrophosphatase (non-canonical NTP hydrolase)